MTENKRFKLYDSLEFFWKKKIWFIIIPIIVAMLGYVGSMFIPKDGDYVGKSTIFTGSVTLEALTNPDNIMTQYGKHFTGKAEIFVPTRNYIETEVYGDNEEQVTKDINLFNEQLLGELMIQHKKVIEGTELHAEFQVNRIQNLEQSIKQYRVAIEKSKDLSEIMEYTSLIRQAETDLTNALTIAQKVRNDIILYEKPGLAKSNVVKAKSYGEESAIAGLILGILLTIFILTLWKYILEARASKREQTI